MGSSAGGLSDLWDSEDGYMFDQIMDEERFRREVRERLNDIAARLVIVESELRDRKHE